MARLLYPLPPLPELGSSFLELLAEVGPNPFPPLPELVGSSGGRPLNTVGLAEVGRSLGMRFGRFEGWEEGLLLGTEGLLVGAVV